MKHWPNYTEEGGWVSSIQKIQNAQQSRAGWGGARVSRPGGNSKRGCDSVLGGEPCTITVFLTPSLKLSSHVVVNRCADFLALLLVRMHAWVNILISSLHHSPISLASLSHLRHESPLGCCITKTHELINLSYEASLTGASVASQLVAYPRKKSKLIAVSE